MTVNFGYMASLCIVLYCIQEPHLATGLLNCAEVISSLGLGFYN